MKKQKYNPHGMPVLTLEDMQQVRLDGGHDHLCWDTCSCLECDYIRRDFSGELTAEEQERKTWWKANAWNVAAKQYGSSIEADLREIKLGSLLNKL